MLKRVIFLLLLCCSLGQQASAMGKFRTAAGNLKQQFVTFLPYFTEFKTNLVSKMANFSSYRSQLGAMRSRLGSSVREKLENPKFRLGVAGLFTASFLTGVAAMPKKPAVEPKDTSWTGWLKSFVK
jgi:hypothetical protein